MREVADNEKLLIQYLLGILSEEQRLQVEGKFLGDDQLYERLLALEDELFYDYAQGKLSPAEREQFEKRFLTSEQNRRRAMLASALIHNVSEAASVERTRSNAASREPQFSSPPLKSYFSFLSRAMKFSLAALAILLLAIIWLVVGNRRLRNEFEQLRAEQVLQEDLLQRQARQERAHAEELNLKLQLEIDENALLKQELGKLQVQSAGQGERLPSVISLALDPSVVRDQAMGMKKLYIPPTVRRLKLQLNLKAEAEYKSYQVTLLTVDGAERWSQDQLRMKRRGAGQAIIVSLPSRVLEEGDYELRLKGTAPDGTQEETGNYYYFSIVRN
jgi:hypothetical protein